MLDLKRIRSETDRVREAIALKNTQADLDRCLILDEERRGLLVEVERLKHERNDVSEEIGRLKRAGKDAADKVAAMKRVGEEIKALDARIAELESELEKILAWIPNVPHPSVPRAANRPSCPDCVSAAQLPVQASVSQCSAHLTSATS